jgi:hypothetical protein
LVCNGFYAPIQHRACADTSQDDFKRLHGDRCITIYAALCNKN